MPFAFVVENGKTQINCSQIVRCAVNFNASAVFTVGHRYRRGAPDTVNGHSHFPIVHFDTWDDYVNHTIGNWIHVGVELTDDAVSLQSFAHPRKCVYLVGPEDGSLSKRAQSICKHMVKIQTRFCLNQACAALLVMYDRAVKA